MPAPNAPTPGSTVNGASRTSVRSRVTIGFAPTACRADTMDAIFAIPEFTTATVVTAPLRR